MWPGHLRIAVTEKQMIFLFLSVKKLNSKNWIFLQKSSCGFWSVTLEALYQQRRHAALVTTTDSRCFHFAHNGLRNLIIFVSRYLKFLVSEEICGRFGSFDEQTTAYRLTRATSYEDVR